MNTIIKFPSLSPPDFCPQQPNGPSAREDPLTVSIDGAYYLHKVVKLKLIMNEAISTIY